VVAQQVRQLMYSKSFCTLWHNTRYFGVWKSCGNTTGETAYFMHITLYQNALLDATCCSQGTIQLKCPLQDTVVCSEQVVQLMGQFFPICPLTFWHRSFTFKF
jgi:hypothetical protein